MIYPPEEDSYLLEEEAKKRVKGKRVLDLGTGSGIQARAALTAGAKKVLAVDIDSEVVEKLKNEKFEARRSDLFSNVKEKFDLIIFNPPYLPRDEREDYESARATTGGKKGDEIIVRFLENAGKHLEKEGKILLVISSLTPLTRIEKVLKKKNFKRKVISSTKLFMEVLEVWEIRKS